MTANTSATGGVLTPAATPAPLEGDDLDNFFQAWIVGISGLAGNLVRPRWQPTPPTQPDPSVTWAAVGITDRTPDANPYFGHIPGGNGADQYQRHEVLTVLVSAYGPNAATIAAQLRDGVYVPQNLETLTAQNMGLVDAGSIVSAPEIVNGQWLKRYDITIRVRRQIVREYPVENLIEADGTITTDGGVVTPFASTTS